MSEVQTQTLDHLGGIRRLSIMVGAKDFRGSGTKVLFKIGKGAKKKINKVSIELNGLDLYDVVFSRVWGKTDKVISTHKNVYNDGLVELFEAETGFYLSF